MSTPIEKLFENYRQISLLGQISGVMSWDQEVMMPAGGAEMRADQLGLLAEISHERCASKALGELLEEVDFEGLSETDRAHMHELRLIHERATKIPSRLAVALAKTTSKAHHVWADARKRQDFSIFAPILAEVVALKREEAECLRANGQSTYDALLHEFEPGTDEAQISELFNALQPKLRELRAMIAQKPTPSKLEGHFPKSAQLALSKDLAEIFQYPFHSGRIDLSAHPFSTGAFDDTRITTRVDEGDPWNCLYSTIHEVGHSVYEFGISRLLMNKPAGVAASLGVHESQSRFFENQIGRSRAFMNVLAPKLETAFGVSIDPEDLYRKINRVETGFIRTEADEIHYNLHVILRFNLERDLFAGDIQVTDLEHEWNKRFEEDFGLEVPNSALGVLQDVHWSMGAFGYFPTYSLGNIYAACLNEAVRADIPTLDGQVATGENGAWVEWMRENVHQHGRLFGSRALIEKACGKQLSVAPLLDYLSAKFSELYAL